MKLRKIYNSMFVKLCFTIAVLMSVLGSVRAEPDPNAAFSDAVSGLQTQVTAVQGIAGAIMVAVAISGGLWMLVRRWAGRASRGG